MMEASLVADTGQTAPLIVTLDAPSIQPSTQAQASSSVPSRPLRPKPPAPPAPKLSQNPSRPPLPPATAPSLPPPLAPIVISTSSTICFNPPPNLPPPLSPTPATPTSPTAQKTDASPTTISSSVSSSSDLATLVSPLPPALSLTDQLQKTSSIWQPKGLSQDQATSILNEEQAGTFLVHSTEERGVTLSVRLPDQQGLPVVHDLMVKQHKTFLHLDGSFLAFDDIFKLICFYCVSRDILPLSLRLPPAISTATKQEELEVMSATGKDFWTSNVHQQSKTQDCSESHSKAYLFLNPVIIDENPMKEQNEASTTSKPETVSSQNAVVLPLQNGETPPKVKGQHKPSVEIKFKRPPPRPPSLSGGTGLLFSTPTTPPAPIASPAAAVTDKKEEGKIVGEKDEKKSASNLPSRPPVPSQKSAPPLPPAPLRRSSSRKSTDRQKAEGTEREKGHNLTKQIEKEGVVVVEQPAEAQEGNRPALSNEGQESGCQRQQEEDGEKDDGKENEVEREVREDQQKPSSQQLVKKPSRPVPPPRRKPLSPETSNQAGGATRHPPPSPGRRPDVSLYSPQGGAVLATDPDSASTSSTEEEVESHDQSRYAESRSPKAGVKRTATTVILDRARHRLSTVLTGLISHDRRLTQRIVELARDPSSYFGNLVKEHRAFTLETMSKHASSTELLQEIRQMMTQLKSYLLQSTELQVMLEQQHQYAQDKLESIVEAALCKSVLKPLREPIYQCLEKLHNDSGSVSKLAQNQSSVLGSTTTALGVTTAVPEASAMEKISIKLSNLHLEYSPQRKIEMLLKACKIIYDSMSVSSPGRAHGADDFLPVMMYVLARSNLSDLQLDVEYMMELMDPALTLGEGSYYLTTTYGAVEHIKTFDQQRSATRQLSREVQDSIHRWERRRTLNQERSGQTSVRDFLTVCCPQIDTNPKTLGVLPTTTIQQLSEQCASRFEQEISLEDSYILSMYIDDVHRPLAPTEVALSVKNSCQPGAYCFVYHPKDQPVTRPFRSTPSDPPPTPPPGSPTAPPTVSRPAPPPVSPPVPKPLLSPSVSLSVPPPTTPAVPPQISPPVPRPPPPPVSCPVPPLVSPPLPPSVPPPIARPNPPPNPPLTAPPTAPPESPTPADTECPEAVAAETEEESLINL